jgi:hypothetical protein
VLSFYRTSSVVVSPDTVGDLEKAGVSDFSISYKSVALSPSSWDGKTGKRKSQHVVIAPSPVKERGRVQPIGGNASWWLRFRLWFNTYRYVLLNTRCIILDADVIIRKFFTFIVLLNIAGLTLAIMDEWPYPRQYTDALALGNLLTAILIRNELFGRFLYLSVNKLFAKVRGTLTILHESDTF